MKHKNSNWKDFYNINRQDSRRKTTEIVHEILFCAIMSLITMLFLYPIFLMLISSFKSQIEIFSSPFSLPTELDLGNYIRAMQKMGFSRALMNSLILTICSIAGLLTFGSMAAYVCARNKSKLAGFIYLVFVSCIIVPFQTAMVPLVKFMSFIRLSNTYVGVILVYISINISFTVFLYRGFIKAIPIEIEEAAIVDGCSRFGVFRSIILPLAAPITATVAILSSLNIWNDFLIPLLLISSPSRRNIPNALFVFHGQYNNQWDMSFAAIILSILPMIIFYIALQKKIIKGIAQGAIKG